MSAPPAGHLSDEELLKLAPMGPPNQIVTGAADNYQMLVVSTAFEPYLPVGNLFYTNMAVGILLKFDNFSLSAYPGAYR